MAHFLAGAEVERRALISVCTGKCSISLFGSQAHFAVQTPPITQRESRKPPKSRRIDIVG